MGISDKLNAALSKEAATAAPGYSRWLMAAAALLIHFPLGQAYGFPSSTGHWPKCWEPV